MEYNDDKVDELTLALMYLVIHDENEFCARPWKGFDWESLNRLYQKGYFGNPQNKAKSVVLTQEGIKKSKELFVKYFVKSY
jgi:hypothetical protein